MEGNGSLIFQIYSAHMAIPIKDVSVTVSSAEEDSNVIAHRITDESGLTKPVFFSTPDAVNSTSPGELQSFTRTNIRLSHPGYYDVIIKNVQIFPDIESIQQMEMIPLPENTKDHAPRILIITPQTL